MTIAAISKVTLVGMSQNKALVLEALQSSGYLHLIAINPKKTSALTTSATTLIDDIKKALYYLQSSPQIGKQKKQTIKFNADETVSRILENQSNLRDAIDKHDFLQERIKDLSVWGNFVLPRENDIGNIKLWFYKIRIKDISQIPNNLTVQEIHRSMTHVYIIVLAENEPPPFALSVPRIHTGSVPLKKLQLELLDIIEKINDLTEERQHLTRYRWLLLKELAHFGDRTALQQAHTQVREQEHFFLVQGWLPKKQLTAMAEFCEKHNLSMVAEDPSPDEVPPTLMETYRMTSAGSELVSFYQTPGYYSLDPSLMVFFSFAVFFAMILADAGYGLIITLIILFTWKKMSKYRLGTWLKPLMVTICVFSIAYGMIVGSYFGVTPSPNSFFANFKLLDLNNFHSMIKIVIAIGCLHVIAANAMRAWFAKSLSAKMEPIGFILIIIGCVLYAWGSMQHVNSVQVVAMFMIIMSLLCIMIFASDLPVTNVKSLMKRSLQGLAAVANLSSLFGDILSYLRLFALGLAGASLAMTFNQIAAHISANTLQGHGWILGLLVLLFGQTLNFVLCLMSGVIHGLRLNYIEFFKWSIKEDGYAFAPLRKTEVPHE